MREAIQNFAKQFGWDPRIENAERLPRHDKFIVAGMGGSHLAAGLLGVWKPDIDAVVHRDYGLPPRSEGRLIIASSYSGNTEETIDAFEEAGRRGLSRAAVTTGGRLLQLAQESNTPYVRLPDIGIQPRSALGFSMPALLKLMGEEDALREIGSLAAVLDVSAAEEAGENLAEKLRGHIPVIYASSRNAPIGYTWKIKFNETAKIPAFCNVFPELNHNEMTGFDAIDSTRGLSDKFSFIFLKDPDDSSKVQKRMKVTEGLFRNRGFRVSVIELQGRNIFHKMFSSLLLADWTAYYTADFYGADPEKVPMVEEFKRLVSGD